MNVLYTCDNNYVWLMGVSTISLFENNRHIDSLTVYLLGEDISVENRKMLNDIAEQYNREIIVIDVPELAIPETLISARWPLSAFTRLYAGDLLPKEVENILYLDCDTIVVGGLEEFCDLDFIDKTICGVKDCVGKFYKENIGLKEDDIYINAGVLFMNLKRLRSKNISVLIEKYMKKYIKRINYADQDVLNGIFAGDIHILNPKYDVMTIYVVHTYDEILKLRKPTNFYSKEELKKAVCEPSIIHYTTNMLNIRPWFADSEHPLKGEFLKYKDISPWKNRASMQMKFTAKEAKVIKVINYLPRRISLFILGVIHSFIKPLYIRMRAN